MTRLELLGIGVLAYVIGHGVWYLVRLFRMTRQTENALAAWASPYSAFVTEVGSDGRERDPRRQAAESLDAMAESFRAMNAATRQAFSPPLMAFDPDRVTVAISQDPAYYGGEKESRLMSVDQIPAAAPPPGRQDGDRQVRAIAIGGIPEPRSIPVTAPPPTTAPGGLYTAPPGAPAAPMRLRWRPDTCGCWFLVTGWEPPSAIDAGYCGRRHAQLGATVGLNMALMAVLSENQTVNRMAAGESMRRAEIPDHQDSFVSVHEVRRGLAQIRETQPDDRLAQVMNCAASQCWWPGCIQEGAPPPGCSRHRSPDRAWRGVLTSAD